MLTLDEAYQTLIDSTDEGGANEDGLTAKQIFLAGAAAEREAVLAIVDEVRHLFDGDVPYNTQARANIDGGRDACKEIANRIRQRGEEGK